MSDFSKHAVSDCWNVVPTIRRSVYTKYTPPACIMNHTVFSQAQIIYVHVAQELNGSGLQHHHCAHENSSVIWSAMSSPCWSLPVHHNTKDHLDSTTFFKTILYTEHFFQNLYSRQAALTNRSRTSITRVAETRATPQPHTEQNRWTQERATGEPRQQSPSQTCITPSQTSTPTSFQQTLITFYQIQLILVLLCCMSLRTMSR